MFYNKFIVKHSKCLKYCVFLMFWTIWMIWGRASRRPGVTVRWFFPRTIKTFEILEISRFYTKFIGDHRKYWTYQGFPIFPTIWWFEAEHPGGQVPLPQRVRNFQKTMKTLEIFEILSFYWKFIGNHRKYWKYQGFQMFSAIWMIWGRAGGSAWISQKLWKHFKYKKH